MSDFPVLIGAAFSLGLLARFLGLPPLVGFLVAGFALRAAGFSSTPTLLRVADVGITLLLFTIGLKLRVRTLLRAEVWAGASLQMLLSLGLFGALLYLLGFGILGDLDLATAFLLAFALSFSSTVFAVKVFEEQGQAGALHARTAIGMLIVQDLIAVVFLAASTGKVPSPWALCLLLLIPGRHLLIWLMDRSGHGELLLLLGIMMALQGSALFELVSVKGDLGALVFGTLVASHPKAKEMSKSLMGFKDLFLVGFFLTIGLRGIPSLPDLRIALFLVVLIPIKIAIYFGVLTRFKLRARTATMASLGLANYSEFGLIVGALGVASGWLSSQWLTILAVAVALTFIVAAPLNTAAHAIYDRFRNTLLRFQTASRIPEEEPVDVGNAELVIFGMGRIGTGAYEALSPEYGGRIIGVDRDPARVQSNVEAGRHVIQGDPTDIDFWERAVAKGQMKVVMLTLPNQRANLVAAEEIRQRAQSERILVSATALYDDQLRELEANGVDAAFNLYAEAGQGFADFVRAAVETEGAEL